MTDDVPKPASRRRSRLFLLMLGALVLAGAGAASAFPIARAYWRSREANALTRGAALAARKGCFACHGPGGTQGISNPGAKGELVPAWDGGTAMMYVEDAKEVAEYVADGLPARRRADKAYAEQLAKARIQMPAYRDILSEKDQADITAYVVAVSGIGGPPEGGAAAKGRELSREHGCFACHGPDGAGLVPNPGSFKGYIPGWRGPDFDELVENDGELSAWIMEGGIPRFSNSGLARSFIEAQKTQMPPFKGVLKDDELLAITAYVKWVRENR
jgi:mono/diheme cytochrome c family protein